MSKLQTIHVKRFKCINDASLDVDALNVLIGANNAGKSTIIQALHLVVGVFQSMALNDVNNWGSTSLSPGDLIYTPTSDVYSMGYGGRLIEAEDRAIDIDLVLEDGNSCGLQLRRGRNGNLKVAVRNVEVARALSSLKAPFSIFSPGLAGIARHEQLLSDGVLLRTLARGDANLVLRNILYRLSEDRVKWQAFLDDLHQIFPSLDLEVKFNRDSDEFIKVTVNVANHWIPIELSGTGILQATQILSYIHQFSPNVIVLDEPDSHLHPNNQRLLCTLLQQIVEERDTQVLLTTHSRHIVDSLTGIARFLWVRNSGVDVAKPDDEIGILLDIGALDVKERLAVGDAEVVVLTEDTKHRGLDALLEASGFDLKKTLVLPYHGVTAVKNLRPLVDIINTGKKRQIVVHRDRDFLTEDQVEQWKTELRAISVKPFVTTGTDVESHFVNAAHLAELNVSDDERGFKALILQVNHEQHEDFVKAYVNGKIGIARSKGQLAAIDYGQLAVDAQDAVRDHANNRQGKMALKLLRKAFQEKHGKNLLCDTATSHISVEALSTIARHVFGDQ